MAFCAVFQEAICSVLNSSTHSLTKSVSSRPHLATCVLNKQHVITSTFIYLNTGRLTHSPHGKSLPSLQFQRRPKQCIFEAAAWSHEEGQAANAWEWPSGLAHVLTLSWEQSRPSLTPRVFGRSWNVWKWLSSEHSGSAHSIGIASAHHHFSPPWYTLGIVPPQRATCSVQPYAVGSGHNRMAYDHGHSNACSSVCTFQD